MQNSPSFAKYLVIPDFEDKTHVKPVHGISEAKCITESGLDLHSGLFMVPLSQLTEETFQACLHYCMDFAPSLSHLLISYYNVFLGSDKVSWFVVDFTKFLKFFPIGFFRAKNWCFVCFCLRGAPARVLDLGSGPARREIFITKQTCEKNQQSCDYFREFDFDFSLIVCVQIQAISKIRRFYRKPSVTWIARNQTTSKLKICSIEIFREITQRINVAFTNFWQKILQVSHLRCGNHRILLPRFFSFY